MLLRRPAQATWSSSSNTIATVAGGLVTATGTGAANIAATYNSVSGASTITVSLPVTGLAISPSSPTLTVGAKQQLTATATYSDKSTKDVTSSATWTSTNQAIVTVSSGGLLTAVAGGTTTVSGSFGGQLRTATVIVKASGVTLKSIAVTPSSATVAAGKTVQLTATGTYSDASTADVTTQATWTSSNTTVASVSGGLVSGLTAGSSTITATVGTVSGTSAITATTVLSSVTVTPSSPTLTVGGTVQLAATAHYSDGTSKDVTASASWLSSNAGTASVGSGGLVTGVAGGNATITATYNNISVTSSVTVKASVTLSSISITPSTPTLVSGATLQLTATGTYSDSTTADLTAQATWTSSNTSAATVVGGLVTAKAAGNSTVTATYNGVSGSSAVKVVPSVSSLAITPSNPTLNTGGTVQLTATATYSDGTTGDVTASTTWQSSATAVATVTPGGMVTAVTSGSATIQGSFSGVNGASTITVKSDSATLVGIAVTPADGTVIVTKTLQMTATGTYSDSTTADITSQVTWASSDTTLATVDNNGVVTGVATGGLTLTASMSGVSGSASVQVRPALTSITVLPANPTIEPNTQQAFTASGNFSDGSQEDLTAQVTWTSSDNTVASIDTTGLATAVANGTATITANLSGVSGNTALTVATSPSLTSILVDQDGETVPLGVPLQLTATGVYSDGSTQALVGVTFTSSDLTIVSVDANGVATPLTAGSVTITAALGNMSGTGTLTVAGQTLVSIATAPTTASVPVGMQQQFTVTGTFSDSSTQQITTGLTWTSSDPTVASADQNGLATAISAGSTTVTASIGALSTSATLTATTAQLQSIAITPATATMPATVTQQFTATGTFSDSTTLDLTNTATWVSSNGSFASVSNTGLALGIAPGTVTITASSGSVSGSATLTIDTAKLVSITVTPATDSVTKGTRVKYTATGTFSDGTSFVLNGVSWHSSKPSIAHINGSGVARAHKKGTVTITAKYNGVSGTATLTVN